MRNRKIQFVLLCVVMLTILAGCTNHTETTNQVKTKLITDESKPYVGFLLDTLKSGKGAKDKEVIEKAVTELGGEIKTLAANGLADVQLNQAKLLIAEGVDVLVVGPYDATLAGEIVTLAHEAGIKVISYDRLIKDVPVDYYITFDSVKVGELQAKEVLKHKSTGKFVYIGGSDVDNNAHLLKEGTMKVLQPLVDSGDIKIVHEQFTTNWNAQLAESDMKEVLKSNSVDAVITANDGLANGIINALKMYGREGNVLVTGQDGDLDAIHRVIAGTQLMTVFKSAEIIAKEAAQLAIKLANNEVINTSMSTNNGAVDVPTIMLNPVVVTKDNIKETVIADGYYTDEQVYKK